MSKRNAQAPLVSIVVPVYKVEPYLRQCLDSILAQTYKNLEVILVDDGSPDGCGAICDECSKKDGRVVAFHKPNGGLSDARNFGLRHAHGEWVSFIDSDDFVSPVFIEALYTAAVRCGCPVAAVPGGRSFRDGEPCELLEMAVTSIPESLSAHKALEKMLYQEITTGVQWRLYRRDVLGEDPFPVGLYYEDLATTYRFVHRARGVALLDCRDLYAYRIRATSIIREEYSPVKATSALAVSDQLYDEVCAWYPELAKAAASRCFSVCRMVYGQCPRGEKESRGLLWNALRQHRITVLLDPSARRSERAAAFFAMYGPLIFSIFCSACRKLGLMR